MGRFLLAFLMVLIMLVAFAGSLFAADKLGFIKLEELILKTVSIYPKLKDLPKSYELGRGENLILEREKEKLQSLQKKLRTQEVQLAASEKKLRAEKEKLARQLKALPTPEPEIKPTATPKAKATPTDSKTVKDYLESFNLMKPAKVAAVLQKLPDETVLEILQATEERQNAKIFECLPAEYLASLTKQKMSR